MKLFADKVTACWIGKSQGGGLGTPYEGGPYRLNLTEKELFLDLGPNDDLELQLLWLICAEKYAGRLTSAHLAEAWREHIKYGKDE